MESLLHRYNRTEVLYDLDTFLTDFTLQESAVPLNEKKYESIDKAYCLGETPLFSVFEVHHHHVADARVALTKQAVEIMKSRQKFTECALFFFVPKNSDSFRISLVTVDWADNKRASNPRRFSFLVGENQKIHTASQQLSSSVRSREDLLKRFSIEVVNDEFYKKISEHFENLLKQIDYSNVCEQAKQEEAKRNFSVRLIGRLIFCWFLKKKLRQDGTPLIPESLLSSCIVGEYDNYYHDVLEPLFFETLNKPFEDRIAKCKMGDFQNIPFLNGGLFEAHLPVDGYKYDKTTEPCSLGASVTIQNNWFIKFFETLETYNFTIDENTSTDIDLAVDPEMLGRIFENLLASINPETKESVRKATGSYYTPREIVDYMVTQSLKQYLYTKTDISHGVIDSLFDFEDVNISDADKEKIKKALLTIKVLDPAVGSGAFPMGMLQKMLAVLNRMGLSTQNSINKTLDYQHKLDIIQHCIYGVDIQPMAIEICRLRFFLTLIVDESSDNPQPLPNLNFNFACANALIPLDNNNILELKQKIQSKSAAIEQKEKHPLLKELKERNILEFSKEQQEQLKTIAKEITKLKKEKDAIKKELGMADVNSFLNGEDYIAQLRAYRKEFFASSGKNKEILKNKFIETQSRMLDALRANDWGNEKVIKLQAWKPFENNSTDWFDPAWMFDVEDGFDIVIANPPYIDSETMINNDLEWERKFLQKHFQNLCGNWDIYMAFFELALSIGRNVSFITPDKWLSKPFGLKFRQNQMRNYLIEITRAGSTIFTSATVDAIITLFSKKKKQLVVNRFIEKNNIEQVIKCDISTLESPYLIDCLFSENSHLIEKIDSIKTKMKTLAPCENACATSDFYIVRDLIKENLNYNSNEYYKLINTGTIGKYVNYWAHKPISYGGKFNFPVIKKTDFNSMLGKSYIARASSPKLIFKGLNLLDVVLDAQAEFIPGKSTLVICSESISLLKFLLGILNSKLPFFYIKNKYASSSYCGGITFSRDMFNNFPIPKSKHNEILLIVDKILAITQTDDYLSNKDKQNRVKAYQDEIDQMVYKLYGLTEEEIKIVEESQLKKIKN